MLECVCKVKPNNNINTFCEIHDLQCNVESTKICDNQVNGMINNAFPFHTTGINISSLNVNHIFPKLDELKFHLSQKLKPHILGLCETFLHNNIKDNQLHIKNYNFERKDRQNKQGGGLIVYISENISYIS